jgi:hypothetical protein
MTERQKFMRDQANDTLELTKGFTPEQRKEFSNAASMMESLAFYVLELTNEELIFSQVGVCPLCDKPDIKEVNKKIYVCENCGCEWE